MTEEELDVALMSLSPYRDSYVESLDLLRSESRLLAEIVSSSTNQTLRSTLTSSLVQHVGQPKRGRPSFAYAAAASAVFGLSVAGMASLARQERPITVEITSSPFATSASNEPSGTNAAGRTHVPTPSTVPPISRTLPPKADLSSTPITVPNGSALRYWRWLPDLDISERATSLQTTELCWRTPVGAGCLDDTFQSPNVGVIPTKGGVIVLARPGIILIKPAPTDPLAPKFKQAPLPNRVTATLSDGSTTSAKILRDEKFGVGYARIVLRNVSVVTAKSQ